jgi:hypothetical protein
MSVISCKDLKEKLACDIATKLGQALFGTELQHLGYVVLWTGAGLVFLYVGWMALIKSKS